jgi:hypothetical protein
LILLCWRAKPISIIFLSQFLFFNKKLNSHKNVKINFYWFGWFILWWYFNFISNFFVEKLESFNVSFSFKNWLLFIHHSFSDSLNPLSFMEKDRNKFFQKERFRKTNKFIQTHSFLWFLFSFTKNWIIVLLNVLCVFPFSLSKKRDLILKYFIWIVFSIFLSRPKTKTKNQSTFQNVIFNQYRQDLNQFQKTGIIAAEQCNSIANHSIAICCDCFQMLFLFYICCFFIMVNHQNFSNGLLKLVRQRIQLNLYCEIHSSFIDLHLFKSHSLSNRHSMRFNSFPTIVIENSFRNDLSS